MSNVVIQLFRMTVSVISAFTTNVASLNPVHGEVNLIQNYVIKFVSDLRWLSPVSSTNKTDRHDTAEILLKVSLNTIKKTKHIHSDVLNYKMY